MSMSTGQRPHTSGRTMPCPPILRRLVLSGTVLCTALLLQSAPAQGLAAPATPPLVASHATRAGAAVTPAASPNPTAPAPAAVGRLTPSGCARDAATATDTCDLYAAPGNLSIVGSAPLPIWGLSTSPTGPATTPGPNLVVAQGDKVIVTLHNGVAGQSMSLAFPGIPASSFSPALDQAAMTTGAGNGGTQKYTFTASRPGTFLYEAGHTPNGARQVAMGLVGALVVLPQGGTAYGTADSAYDDEAVMVLSELDPALNANPGGFDMRSYRPAYRLINGNAFPEIPAVATEQTHRVLLRYLNAGAQQHPMTILGATQTRVASDGHQSAFVQKEVTAVLEPGATEDTIVTMTSGGPSKLTLFESGIHLDNNGQHTSEPLQTAFGGMMTVLDTNAPPPSTDTVGPTSSAVTAGPNPASGLVDVAVTATVSDATTGGTAVDNAEFVVDDASDTAVGNGTRMTLSGSGVTRSATGTLTVATMANLAAGRHIVYVRGHDSAGSTGNWGVVGSVVLNLPKTGPATTGGAATPSIWNQSGPIAISATGDDSAAGGAITQGEYFVTTDATPLVVPTDAPGSGAAMTLNRQTTIVAETANLPTAPLLAEGKHHAWVRSYDSLGLWGPLLDIPFTVDRTGPVVSGAEVGPNPSNGVVSAPANPGYAVVSASITDAGAGWGSNLADAEAFLDTRGADGSGVQLIPTDGKLDSPTESVYGLIPLTQIRTLSEGTHHVLVHGKDAAGNWGADFVTNLLVDKTAPTLDTLTVSPNPTAGAALVTARTKYTDASGTIGAAEFWFGATDPGVGNASAVTVSLGTDGYATIMVPMAGVPAGAQQLHIRISDKAGNWSGVATAAVTVNPPPVMTESFDSTTLNPAWAKTAGPVGTVTVVAGANLPAPAGGSNGLQVTYPTTNGARQPAYISRSLGTTLTSAHVDIDLNAANLTTGAATPTVFVATTSTGATVFALELRTANGAKQVRADMGNSGGGVRKGNWVNLPSGAVTIDLTWQAGRRNGASPGTLLMAFNHGPTVSTRHCQQQCIVGGRRAARGGRRTDPGGPRVPCPGQPRGLAVRSRTGLGEHV